MNYYTVLDEIRAPFSMDVSTDRFNFYCSCNTVKTKGWFQSCLGYLSGTIQLLHPLEPPVDVYLYRRLYRD